MYAALLALKLTFGPFCLFHALFSTLAVNRVVGSWKTALRWIARVGVGAGVGVAPWFATHLPNYFSKSTFDEVIVPQATQTISVSAYVGALFGGGFTRYTVMVGLALFAGSFAIAIVWVSRSTASASVWRKVLSALHIQSSHLSRNKQRVAWGVFAAAAAGGLSYLVAIFILGESLGYHTGLRYAIPAILGCAVPAIVLSLRLPGGGVIRTPLLAGVAILLLTFAPALMARARQALKSRNTLAFSSLAQHPMYLHYNQFCLSQTATDQIRQFQEKVPTGEPLLAWVNTPFLLDYERNPIVVAEESGLISPWAHVPRNVCYVLVQTRGHFDMGTRDTAYYQRTDVFEGRVGLRIQAAALRFLRNLNDSINKAELIANDGELTLVRIPSPNPAPRR